MDARTVVVVRRDRLDRVALEKKILAEKIRDVDVSGCEVFRANSNRCSCLSRADENTRR
jgi:hypothetical protein